MARIFGNAFGNCVDALWETMIEKRRVSLLTRTVWAMLALVLSAISNNAHGTESVALENTAPDSNDEEQVTLDTVRDLIDKGAEQSRKFFKILILYKHICITLLM